MALAYGPGTPAAGAAVALKTTLAAYRGATCGVAYAEALRALNAYPQDILDVPPPG